MRTLSTLFGLAFALALMCVCLFIVLPVIVVSFTIDQMPFGREQARAWMMNTPQPVGDGGVDFYDNAYGPILAGKNRVDWLGYRNAAYGLPNGSPFRTRAPLGCPFGLNPGYTDSSGNMVKHVGLDLPVNSGTDLYATMGGQVVATGYIEGGWGQVVVIEANGYQTWFTHLTNITVAEGDLVEAGAALGTTGGGNDDPLRGNSSGAHLHYGIRYKPDQAAEGYGEWLNPEDYLDSGNFELFSITTCGGQPR